MTPQSGRPIKRDVLVVERKLEYDKILNDLAKEQAMRHHRMSRKELYKSDDIVEILATVYDMDDRVVNDDWNQQVQCHWEDILWEDS